jgi:hypothetical protein
MADTGSKSSNAGSTDGYSEGLKATCKSVKTSAMAKKKWERLASGAFTVKRLMSAGIAKEDDARELVGLSREKQAELLCQADYWIYAKVRTDDDAPGCHMGGQFLGTCPTAELRAQLELFRDDEDVRETEYQVFPRTTQDLEEFMCNLLLNHKEGQLQREWTEADREWAEAHEREEAHESADGSE